MAKDKTKYVGERYESKHGKYEIIEYIGGSHSKVKVKFDLTGSEVICRYDTAYKGFALSPLLLNYGPFTSLDAAINMANCCYASVGLNQLIIPTNNIMQIQQIFQYTDDRKIAIKRVK